MKYVRPIFSIICLLIFGWAPAQIHTETISFTSANPFSLNDIIEDLENQPQQRVFGKLTLPVDSLAADQKFPLIIGVAGSLDWRAHHLEYMQMYQQAGFATFELQSFASRNISSTVGSQDQTTIAALILDAYRALDTLGEHPAIDPTRVALTGWSLGGGVSLFSGWLPLREAIGPKYHFAAHLAFYPPCFFKLLDTQFTQAPIHILIGEADDWTPAAPCQNLVQQLAQNTSIGLTTYPRAHHGFDSEAPVVVNPDGYSFKDCLFDLTAEGDVLMNYLKIPMSNPSLQKLGFMFCVEKGVHIGGNPQARKKSFAFAQAFMQKHLQAN